MSLPLPLYSEDELAVGHLGRIRQWIGASSRAEVVRALRDRAAGDGSDVPPLLQVVAIACGLQVDFYVGRHSMLPFTCFLVSDDPILRRAAPCWSNPVVSKVGYLTPAGLPTFCPDCASEQRERAMYSVWRRSLQLPGQLHCVKHGSRLLQAYSVEAFMEQPSDVLASGRHAEVLTRTWTDDHPAIVRFAACGQAMLATCRSWPSDVAREVLSRRASLLGLRPSKGGTLPLLSDVAYDTFPGSFMEEYFPLSAGKSRGTVVPTIDCAAMKSGNPPTGTAVALAMALLYNSPQEAIDAFVAANQSASPR